MHHRAIRVKLYTMGIRTEGAGFDAYRLQQVENLREKLERIGHDIPPLHFFDCRQLNMSGTHPRMLCTGHNRCTLPKVLGQDYDAWLWKELLQAFVAGFDQHPIDKRFEACFVGNTGKHRSVAMAIAAKRHFEVLAWDVGSIHMSAWSWGGNIRHRGCNECRDANTILDGNINTSMSQL